jgi:hypothetical protein
MDNGFTKIRVIFSAVLIGIILLLPVSVFAQDSATESPDAATFKSICEKVKDTNDKTYGKFPPCATTPSACGTKKSGDEFHEPLNCLFLEEPIGGEPGYDLYKVTCGKYPFKDPKGEDTSKYVCVYSLWHGEAIISQPTTRFAGGAELGGAVERGPVQAVLVFEEGKEYQGPFGLLYNYLGLIYNFMSGIIVAFVILLSIIGGIEMTTSAGDTEKFKKGRERITKALIGMVLWFLASLVLYTINPTFFAF